MDPDARERWAKRLMDDPKVNGDADTPASTDPSVVSDGFADALLRRLGKRADDT